MGCPARLECRQTQEESAAIIVCRGWPPKLAQFKKDVGRNPTTEEGLAALMACPPALTAVWKGPYLDRLGTDPWGRPYGYESRDTRYTLWSHGPSIATHDDDIRVTLP